MKTIPSLLVLGTLSFVSFGCSGGEGDSDSGPGSSMDNPGTGNGSGDATGGGSGDPSSMGGGNDGGTGGSGTSPGGTPGSAGGSTGGSTPVDPNKLAFSNVQCMSDEFSLIEGQSDECTFELVGPAGDEVTLSCEDPSGKPVACDCNPGGETQLQPCDAHTVPAALPLQGRTAGPHELTTSGFEIVWVATTGTQEARHVYKVSVKADDSAQHAPTHSFTCGGDDSLNYSVTVGNELDCRFVLNDADGDRVDFRMSADAQSKSRWTNYGSSGHTPLESNFRFLPDASDKGKTLQYTYTIYDFDKDYNKIHTPMTGKISVRVL